MLFLGVLWALVMVLFINKLGVFIDVIVCNVECLAGV
jgi:hypothetical protein